MSARNALRKRSEECQGQHKKAGLETSREYGAEPLAIKKKMIKLKKWIPGNTKDAPSECAYDLQGSGGAAEVPDP